MTAPVDEKYDGDVTPDDFVMADDPPESPDAGAGDAQYGWTRDRDSGELRPRKRPGRPPAQATPDTTPDAVPVSRAEDRAPGPPAGRARARSAPDAGPPMPKSGVLAAGINKLYRRAGKFLRAFDPDLGEAMIACTRKDPDEPDELTTGEAWENLCKSNPRVRAFWVRAVAGGLIGDLVMAHAPIGVALLMKPWVQRMLPLNRLVESMGEPDDDNPDGEGDLPGGMTSADFGQMKDVAEQQARRMAERMGIQVTDEELAEASAAASARFGGDGIPPGLRRQQPRRQARARRHG